jgi:hypothetical protein
MTDPEADFAIHLANRALADTSRDPDSDLSVLARQLLRCHERISEAGEMIVTDAMIEARQAACPGASADNCCDIYTAMHARKMP